MIELKFNTGNFTLNIAGDLNEESKAELLESGTRYVVQRDVATGVYLQVAGEKNSKGNLQLPKGFERDSIAFSPETAEQFRTAAEKELGKLGNFTVEVVENVGGEGAASPMKRATALVDTFLGTEQEAQWRTILGDGDRDALIEKANTMGLGIQPPRAKKENGEKA